MNSLHHKEVIHTCTWKGKGVISGRPNPCAGTTWTRGKWKIDSAASELAQPSLRRGSITSLKWSSTMTRDGADERVDVEGGVVVLMPSARSILMPLAVVRAPFSPPALRTGGGRGPSCAKRSTAPLADAPMRARPPAASPAISPRSRRVRSAVSGRSGSLMASPSPGSAVVGTGRGLWATPNPSSLSSKAPSKVRAPS